MFRKINFHHAWIILIVVSLIRAFAGAGINASTGLFLKPVASDIKVGIGQLSLSISISSITTLIWLPIAGKYINQYNTKLLAVLAAILQPGSFILLGFMHSIWGWYLLAIPIALGSTLLVNLLGPILIDHWFVKSKGLAIGIMMATGGLLGAFFQPLITNLIALKGWRFAYVVFGGGAFIIITILSILFLRAYPRDKNLLPYGSQHSDIDISCTPSSSVPLMINTPSAMKSLSFYCLILFVIAFTGVAAFSQHITNYALLLGFPLSTVGKTLSLSMIGCSLGALFIGSFSDKIGLLGTGICMIGIGFIGVILYLFCGSNLILFAIGTFCYGLTSSSIGVLAPLLTSAFFGSRDYEKLFSFVMMGAPLASTLLLPAYGFIYDTFRNYNLVFVYLIFSLIVALMSLLIGWKYRFIQSDES